MTDTSDASAPGYQTSQTMPSNRRKKVQGEGRGQPCTQQGLVVQTVWFSRNEYDERRLKMEHGRGKTWAPLGDMSCFQAMQGELAIAAVDNYGVMERNPTSLDSQIVATTTVNGWNKSQDAIFVGVVRNARPLSSQDSGGTVARVGTQTIINTGPDDIMAGDMVYFSLAPYTYTDGTTGEVKPAIEIDEPGQPGYHESTNSEGVYAPKFKPATYAIRDNSMYSFLRRADARLASWDRDTSLSLEDQLASLITHCQVPYQQHAKDMPAMTYALLVAVEHFLMNTYFEIVSEPHHPDNAAVKAKTDAGGDNLAFLQSIEDTHLHDYFERRQEARKKFSEALGLLHTEAPTEWRPSKRMRLHGGLLSTSAAPADVQERCTIGLNAMLSVIKQGKFECICEQHNYLRKRVIGKCIRGAPPGTGMDVALGYGHA